ncbi:MAG: glycosyltransferase family 87 protein [Terracidiphilus sp.]
MTKARKDGLCLLILGFLILLPLAYAFETVNSFGTVDFKAHYYAARTLLSGADPYNAGQVLNMYLAEKSNSYDGQFARMTATHYPYPPMEFLLTAPISALPIEPAWILWKCINIGGLAIASFFIWQIAADDAAVMSGALIGLLLASSEILIGSGNIAALSISLCILGAVILQRTRLTFLGFACVTASVVLKPHDAGFIFLFFLVAGGIKLTRALYVLSILAILIVPSLLWVNSEAPNWSRELKGNMAIYTARGGMNDPGPSTNNVPGSMINLQTILSIIRDDPRVYNPISYLVCGIGLAVCFAPAVRSLPSTTKTWIALAAIAPLTLLIVYHRRLDSFLILLTIPACSNLWRRGGRIGKLALGITVLAILSTGDIALLFTHLLLKQISIGAHAGNDLRLSLQTAPAPLSLAVLASFYLWIYANGYWGEKGKVQPTSESH